MTYATDGEDYSKNHVTGFEELVNGSGLYSDTYAHAALPLQRGKQGRVIVSIPDLQYEKEFLRTITAGDRRAFVAACRTTAVLPATTFK
jgi:hypothetical protein